MSRTPHAAGLIEKAWELSYLDAAQALELGRQIIDGTRDQPDTIEAGFGWLHVALGEVRIGELAVAAEASGKARAIFEAAGLVRGVALADEVRAIQLRRAGDQLGSLQLQDQVNARPGRDYNHLDQFIAHNSRAITCKHLGRIDDALRHFYRAMAHARRTGLHGPLIVALGNLGGFHQDLFNLEDAISLSTEALKLARQAGAHQIIANAASNLIIAHHAANQPMQARAMAEFMLTHADEMPAGALEFYPMPLALGFLCSGEIRTAQGYLDRGSVSRPGDGDGKAFWAWLQARCSLAQGDAATARTVTQAAVDEVQGGRISALPYDLLQLYRAAADTCEQLGELHAALMFTRRAQSSYEELAGRSARARYIALEVKHHVDTARHERDQALRSRQSVEDDRQRLVELNRQLRAQVEATESLQAQLKEQALRDPLTGLHNRRYLREVAPRLLELAARQHSLLCLVIIDLDHFKTLNDTWGHEAGDAVLQAFATLLVQSLRRSDVVCRHGGEEFVVVMPDITIEGAQAMLRRLLEAFQQMLVSTPRRTLPSTSFSAGIATFPLHGDALEPLLQRADRALYVAKNNGRARIELAMSTDFSSLT